MKTNTENLKTKIINNSVTKGGYFKPHIALLSSCPCWIFLIASGLWLVQPNPLKAMEKEEISRKSNKTQGSPNNFYEDSDHPLTQGFWKESDLSYKLKSIGWKLNKIKKEIIKYKINSINIEECELYDYKKIFQCFLSDPEPVQGLSDIKFKDLIITSDDQNNRNNGFSGAIISGPLECNNTEVIIKKFPREEEGLKDLLYSLIALSMNPSPTELKMARIYDAAFCSNNSQNCLSIVMECAPGNDIHHFLATNHSKNSVKACAEYLSTFHIKNHCELKEGKNRKKFLEYAAYFSNTLSDDLIEEQTGPALFSLVAGQQRIDLEDIKSHNIIQLLSKEDQEKFISCLKKTHSHYKNNTSEIFRLIGSKNLKKLNHYFLTILHGDAHGRNFFYTPSADLVSQNGEKIQSDSHLRITMIDFASIIETYGEIGDPAADIGRFLGSLWDWAAQKSYERVDGYEEMCSDEKIASLQAHFFDTYLNKIKEGVIFSEKNPKDLEVFERILKENSNFYKIRYYRAIFNSEKNRKSDEVKINILKSWMKENADLVISLQQNTSRPDFSAEETNLRHWSAVVGGTLHCYLPEPLQGFITSAAEGANTSYLTCLWETLQRTGTPALSSNAAIAGMGGVGKTTLALAYAHEALTNNAYNLIYWLPSGTEISLLKGYRNLLLEIGMTTDNGLSIRNADPQRIIELVKQHVPRVGRSLLIYDNVSDSDFLEGLTPQENTDIVITSRCNEGWKCSLPLEVFRVKDSIKYLCKITALEETDENQKVAENLAEALSHFPLALAHAAHYINLVGGEGISALHFKEYLEDIMTLTTDYFEEKKNKFTEGKSKITYEYLVSRTLRMSEKYLKKKGIFELAKEILACCSYLDPDSIENEIFLDHWPDKNQDSEKIKEALEAITSLSLIKKVKERSAFSIHQLVQLVIREELKNSKEITKLLDTMKVLLSIFESATQAHNRISKNLRPIFDLIPSEAILPLSPAFLGKYPTIDSLNNVEESQLGFFAMDDKLYCKISGKEQIEVTLDNNAIEATQKGLPRNVFNKIMEALVAFDFGVQMEGQGAPIATKHYNDAYESISGSVWTSLLQFISLNGYMQYTAQSLNEKSIGSYLLNIFEEENFNKFSDKKNLELEIDANIRTRLHLLKIMKHIQELNLRFSWYDDFELAVQLENYVSSFTNVFSNLFEISTDLSKIFSENLKYLYSEFYPRIFSYLPFNEEPKEELEDTLLEFAKKGLESGYTNLEFMSEAVLRKYNQESIIDDCKGRRVSEIAKFLITDEMDEEAQTAIIEAIRDSVVDVGHRQELAEAAKLLITNGMKKETLKRIIEALGYVHNGQRQEVAELAKLLITDKMEGAQERIIGALRNILSSERHEIAKATKLLMTERMNRRDLAHIMGALKNVEPRRLQVVVEAAKLLITEAMDGWDRAKIIAALASVESRQLQKVVESTNQLITEEMGGYGRAKIIDALAKVESKRLQEVIEAAKPLITEAMDGSDRAEIIDALVMSLS